MKDSRLKQFKLTVMEGIQSLAKDEDGDISIMFAILVPVLLWVTVYFENLMQARYILNQTQTVLDIATKGGAFTGVAVKSNGAVFCTIPYNPSDPEFSGDHVVKKLLQENLHTLPQYVQDSIMSELNNNRIIGFNDPDLRAGGYVEMKVTFKYRPDTPLLFNQYKFTVSSTAKCQAEAD